MTYRISLPNPTNSSESVAAMLARPDDFILTSEGRDKWRSGLRFPKLLERLLEPDQLKWTQEEISNAAEGIEKVIKLAMPADDLDVLRKYRALALPNELVSLGTYFTHGPNGIRTNGKFKAPFDQLTDMSGFLVPIEWCTPDSRPKTSLGEAFGRQIKRLEDAMADHAQRLEQRAKDYMFGRPIITPRQRVLSHVMEVYPEFDWEEHCLPVLKITERKATKSGGIGDDA